MTHSLSSGLIVNNKKVVLSRDIFCLKLKIPGLYTFNVFIFQYESCHQGITSNLNIPSSPRENIKKHAKNIQNEKD